MPRMYVYVCMYRCLYARALCSGRRGEGTKNAPQDSNAIQLTALPDSALHDVPDSHSIQHDVPASVIRDDVPASVRDLDHVSPNQHGDRTFPSTPNQTPV